MVDAFRSTLEELSRRDLALHVVDASAPDALAQITAAHGVLHEIGAGQVPELLVINMITGASSGIDRTAVGPVNTRLYPTQPPSRGTSRRRWRAASLSSRPRGIFRGERRCTADEAFAILTKLSQDTDRKLRDATTALVTKATADPR